MGGRVLHVEKVHARGAGDVVAWLEERFDAEGDRRESESAWLQRPLGVAARRRVRASNPDSRRANASTGRARRDFSWDGGRTIDPRDCAPAWQGAIHCGARDRPQWWRAGLSSGGCGCAGLGACSAPAAMPPEATRAAQKLGGRALAARGARMMARCAYRTKPFTAVSLCRRATC